MKLVISDAAERDLARIYAWLATHYDLEAAERFRSGAETALSQLGKHPDLGPHPGWATRHRALRFWLISRSSYLIYYNVRGEEVSIERVLDGRRDVHRIIESGLEDSAEASEE
jgi:plasmid stabilization system protein ParE